MGSEKVDEEGELDACGNSGWVPGSFAWATATSPVRPRFSSMVGMDEQEGQSVVRFRYITQQLSKDKGSALNMRYLDNDLIQFYPSKFV